MSWKKFEKPLVFICTISLVLSSFSNIKIAQAAYSDTIAGESNLLYYWQMNESAGASTLAATVGGTAINLTGATSGQSGQAGNSVSFDGASNFGVTASNLNLTSYNKIFVEALVNFNSYPSGNHLAWEHSLGGGLGADDFYLDTGSSALSPAHVGNAGYSLASFTPPSAANWHHLVAAYDKTLSTNEVNIYIDGVLQTANSRSFNTNNTDFFANRPFYVMSRGGTTMFAGGKMQHLAIYNDLTITQIRSHAVASGLVAGVTAGTLSEVLSTTTSSTLSWTSATNGFSPITSQLQRSAHSANSWSDIGGATSSPATDSGLTSNTSYDYRVAYTDATATTVYSNTLTITTLPIVNYPAYTANSDKVIVQPYDTARSNATANWGMSGSGSLEFIGVGHRYRVRQDGTINRVRFYTVSKTGLSAAYVKVWRKNGSTYDLVGTSNNLVSDMTAASFNTIDLSSPITGVQEGDYVGLRIESAGGAVPSFYGYNPGNVTTYYAQNQSFGTTGVNWAGQSPTAFVMPIETYMQAPQAVFIGDSIISGNPAHLSFLETTETTNVGSSIERKYNAATGYTYQNMGIGAQTTASISARFAADVIALHPRLVIIEGGVNDIANGAVTKNTFLANWTSMLNAAQADSGVSKIFVLKILPWINGTNNQMQTRDDWNSSLATLAAGYSKAVVVDASSYVGVFRSGGDPGNLWDMNALYNSGDGVHYNASGHFKIAQALADALDSTPPTITSVSSDKTNGSYSVGEVIDIDVTFSEPVTSTGNVTVTLETGATDRTCTFSVSGSTTGTCNYTVQAGDTSSDLDIVSIGGTIADSENNAMSNFVPTTSLAANKALVIDTTAPSSVGAPTFGTISSSSIEVIKPSTVTETGSGLYQWQARKDSTTELGFNAVGTNSVTNSSLSENTQYTYDAQFKDSALNTSSYGTSAAKYTLVDTPTNLSATSTLNSITLSVDSFPNDTAGSSGYYFERSGANSGWAQTNTWQNTGLTCATSYTYTVKYRNGDGTETSTISLTVSTSVCPSSGGVTPAPASGTGSETVTVGMGQQGTLGTLPPAGLNYISYINSHSEFSVPGTQQNTHTITVNDLNILNQEVTITLSSSNPQTLRLRLNQSTTVDLNGDGKQMIQVTFAGLVNNRIELTIKPLSANNSQTNGSTGSENTSDIVSIIKQESGLIFNQQNPRSYFINTGTQSTLKLGSGERKAALDSFEQAFNKQPATLADWVDVLNIANGRWPLTIIRSVESRAYLNFKLVYGRNANMKNSGDVNALKMMGYGIRSTQARDLKKESQAIKRFISIFNFGPTIARHWNIIRAIAYSGINK